VRFSFASGVVFNDGSTDLTQFVRKRCERRHGV
jgi:hypothetical protein